MVFEDSVALFDATLKTRIMLFENCFLLDEDGFYHIICFDTNEVDCKLSDHSISQFDGLEVDVFIQYGGNCGTNKRSQILQGTVTI